MDGIYGIKSDDFIKIFQSIRQIFYVGCNNISGGFKSGMEINGGNSGIFYQNIINMSNAYMTKGMSFNNTVGSVVDNNSATGGSTNIGTAYNFSQCNSPLVSNNHSSTTSKGFYFQSDNSNTRFLTNDIGLHDIGFYLDGTSVISPQIEVITGNLHNNDWLADISGNPQYTSGFGANYLNASVFGAIYNRFEYYNTFANGTTKFPKNSANGHQWFFPSTNPSIPRNNNDTCYPPHPIINGEGTEFDRLVSQDSIHTENFDPETAQMAVAGLCDNLENNEGLRNSQDYFSDFYNAYVNETPGKQAKVRYSIQQINKDANNNENLIAFNDSSLQILLIKKSQNDSLLYGGGLSVSDSMALVISSNSLLTDAQSIIRNTNVMFTLFTDSQVNKIAIAKDLNDAISPSTTIETNEKQVNAVYLRNLALGIYSLSSTDLGILHDIASQCPFSGGRAVYKARSILSILGDTTLYDDETVCWADENFRKTTKNNKLNTEVIVNPNPTKDLCKFIYRLPKDENASLLIWDSFGTEIYRFVLPLNSISYSIHLGNLSNAVYFYSVKSSSGLIGNGKLILIK